VACHIVGRGSVEAGYRYALEQTNHRNGLELNPGDKHARVQLAYERGLYVDEQGRQPSDRALAENLGVSKTLVSNVRHKLEAEGALEPGKRKGKDGRTRGDPTGNQLPVDEDYPAGDAEAPGSHPGEADADSPTEPQTADAEGQPGEADAGGTGAGEAEPPPPAGGADDEDDEHPSWLPRYGSELQAYADDLRRVNRNRSAQTNASGPWGQAASEVHRTVKQAITKAEAAIPVVCPACGGREGKGCSVCRKSGWLTAGEAEQVSTSKKKKRRKAS
jgi:predicted RNA-binding Zn-ribbon protein involved in translation (DUF1610 family)